MDITHLGIDTVQLVIDIREIESAVINADKQLTVFKNEMDKLNSMWKGKANTAFKNQISIDYNLMSELISDMRKLINSMENAKREYEECENAVKASIDNIRV